MKLHKAWIERFYNNGMILQEKFKGILWFRKRYYFGWSQNIHNFYTHGFLIEADWFDTLDPKKQLKIYKREREFAYMTSIIRGGGYSD